MAEVAEEVPEKTLEYWLSRATDPFLPEQSRQEFVKSFCEQVNQELEGHLVSCRLLTHKIQSPHEKEAINALNVLEACVKNCGQRFHNEIAKFRFLNEVIKILSPKYLGNQTSDKVKLKAVELLYSWKMGLRHLPKIKQAYDMLKEQGIITQDPVYMNEMFEPPPPAPKPKFASFEDEEKSKLLSQLLKSKNADDLQAANRLIKSMVKAEDQRIEKISKRSTELDTACNNAKLLSEMVAHFDKGTTAQQEIEIMKDLAESLQKLRPALFRYAGEAAEGEEHVLADILGVNDEVGKALEDFRVNVEPFLNTILHTKPSSNVSSSGNYALLNFDAQVGQNSIVLPALPTIVHDMLSTSSSETSLFGDDVLMLGGGGTPLVSRRIGIASAATEISDLFGVPVAPSQTALSQQHKHLNMSASSEKKSVAGAVAGGQQTFSNNKPKGLLDLDALSEALIQQNLPTGTTSVSQIQQNKKLSLRDLNPKQPTSSVSSSGPPVAPSFSPLDPFAPSSSASATPSANFAANALASALAGSSSSSSNNPASYGDYHHQGGAKHSSSYKSELKPLPLTPHPTPEMSAAGSPTADGSESGGSGTSSAKFPANLDDVIVPLDAIKPGSKPTLLILDRDQIKIVLHYAANKPRHDVITTVVSITSTRDQTLSDIRFVMKIRDCPNAIIKLQQPTGCTLPAYNPIFPSAAITQVVIFASNFTVSEHIPVEYSLSYSAVNQQYSVSGLLEIELSP